MCIHSIGLWCYAVNMICYPEKFCTTNQSSSLIDFNICNWISELCWKKVHIKVHHSNRISVSITVFQFLDLEKSHLYVWPTYLKSWSILNLTVIVKNLEQQILRYHSNTYQHYYIRLHYGNFFIGNYKDTYFNYQHPYDLFEHCLETWNFWKPCFAFALCTYWEQM